MNWLAHLFLSKPSIHFQLGNILADPLKGAAWDGAPAEVISGMAVHKEIDAFTDAHSLVKQAKSRLGDKGRLRGVVIDMVFDHMLSKNWSLFMKIDRRMFIDDFYREAQRVVENYSDPARIFIETIISTDRLGSYADIHGMEAGFKRVDSRLSERLLARESASQYTPLVLEQYEAIESDFLTFFPELINTTMKNL